MKKNILTWLKTLEEPFKTQALVNYKKVLAKMSPNDKQQQKTHTEVSSGDALCSAFIWDNTPEGHDYWRDHTRALRGIQVISKAP